MLFFQFRTWAQWSEDVDWPDALKVASGAAADGEQDPGDEEDEHQDDHDLEQRPCINVAVLLLYLRPFIAIK